MEAIALAPKFPRASVSKKCTAKNMCTSCIPLCTPVYYCRLLCPPVYYPLLLCIPVCYSVLLCTTVDSCVLPCALAYRCVQKPSKSKYSGFVNISLLILHPNPTLCGTPLGADPHRPRRAHEAPMGASRLPRTSYALLRTIQAHCDTPTAANHPRPRRPTGRLCNGQ